MQREIRFERIVGVAKEIAEHEDAIDRLKAEFGALTGMSFAGKPARGCRQVKAAVSGRRRTAADREKEILSALRHEPMTINKLKEKVGSSWDATLTSVQTLAKQKKIRSVRIENPNGSGRSFTGWTLSQS